MSVQHRTELTSQTSPAGPRRLGLALMVIATAQLMLVLDDTIVNVALPSMQRSLHLATSHLNWVISFYALAFGGLLLAGGRAGDLFGRLRVFRVGVGVFTLASVACGITQDASTLIVARCTVHKEGNVTDCKMICPNPLFDKDVLENLSARRYTPAVFRGEPVDVPYTFQFRIADQSKR